MRSADVCPSLPLILAPPTSRDIDKVISFKVWNLADAEVRKGGVTGSFSRQGCNSIKTLLAEWVLLDLCVTPKAAQRPPQKEASPQQSEAGVYLGR